MTYRKKKLRIIQASLLIIGTFIILFTYFQNKQGENRNIISKETQKKIQDSLSKDNDDSDVFYDISYTGIDLSGNRYILKSQEARNNKSQIELISMKGVNALFYFKDGTILKIQSNKGLYNNKTLDIKFEESVQAFYEDSTLYAEQAEYSNSRNFLSISKKVKIKDVRGEISADKLFFDLKKQTLDIKSSEDNKINANIDYNEKKF